MTQEQKAIIEEAIDTIRGYQKSNEALANREILPTAASEKLQAIYQKRVEREKRLADALEGLLNR